MEYEVLIHPHAYIYFKSINSEIKILTIIDRFSITMSLCFSFDLVCPPN